MSHYLLPYLSYRVYAIEYSIKISSFCLPTQFSHCLPCENINDTSKYSLGKMLHRQFRLLAEWLMVHDSLFSSNCYMKCRCIVGADAGHFWCRYRKQAERPCIWSRRYKMPTHINSVLNYDKVDISQPCSTTKVWGHRGILHKKHSSISSNHLSFIFYKSYFSLLNTHTFLL